MKFIRKSVAIILCICIALSLCITGASAETNNPVTTVSCEEDLKNLDFDVPVVFIIGLEG